MISLRLFNVLSLLAQTAISGALASPHSAGLAGRAMQPGCATSADFAACHSTRRSYRHEGPHRDENPDPTDLTNAERLARRLPLKPPTRRSSARRATASPAPQPVNRGYIEVWSIDDNGSRTGVLGYVSRTTRDLGQHVVQQSLDDALFVSPSGNGYLVSLNSDVSFPAFLGLVQSPEDTTSGLAEGSLNYLVLASTGQTAPNATPQSVSNSLGPFLAESPVWTFDPATNTLTASWINPDGSLAPINPFITDDNSIYFSEDRQQQEIEFVYVSA
ncbi:hypothetical protein MSAN_01273500 [Mycena sanguinolenta]|uniref:Uncharacterized protein n=1 Tax=Mycena sanguinolenta TaxID=230812 RepID=A0A8H6YIG1_9AGAR|nr:hypothetical protein MSAN_01273500 [Mycena sanguinolenta]